MKQGFPRGAAVRTLTKQVETFTSLSEQGDQVGSLVVVDVEGYSVQEAADILGVPVGTVKSRCARGRVRLARLLRERGALIGREGET